MRDKLEDFRYFIEDHLTRTHLIIIGVVLFSLTFLGVRYFVSNNYQVLPPEERIPTYQESPLDYHKETGIDYAQGQVPQIEIDRGLYIIGKFNPEMESLGIHTHYSVTKEDRALVYTIESDAPIVYVDGNLAKHEIYENNIESIKQALLNAGGEVSEEVN